jgi:hypothetical protein
LSAACPSGAAIYAQVLALSLGLATLSVLLGFVLISVPTGASKRLKAAGYTMMMDGYAYLVFMTIINSVWLFMSLALSLLRPGTPIADPQATVESMYAGYNQMLNPDGPFKLTLRLIYEAIGNYLTAYTWVPIIGSAQTRMHWSLINPSLQMLNIALFVTTILYFLGQFIRCAWLGFVAFGAFIYGLPGRVGRNLGAALIATMLVFYVGLPFMPSFVGTPEQPGMLVLPTLPRSENMTRTYLDDSTRLLLEAQQAHAGYVSYTQSNVYINVEQGYLPDGSKLTGGYTSNYLIYLTNGTDTWKLWTDVNGQRTHRLPTGNYRITDVFFIGQRLHFQGGQDIRIEESSNITVPVQLPIYGVRAAYEGREVEGYIELEQTTAQMLSVARDVTGTKYTVQVNVRSESDQLVAYYDKRADLKFTWEEPCTPIGTTVSCGLGPCESFAGISNMEDNARRWDVPMRIDRYSECPCGNCTLCQTCMTSLPQVHTLTIVTNWVIPMLELPQQFPKEMKDEDPQFSFELVRYQDLSQRGVTSLRELADYAARVALEMILAPLLFLLLLTLIAVGIARALGGGRGLPLPGV